MSPADECPRLPVPYVFGAAPARNGFRLSAIDIAEVGPTSNTSSQDIHPFEALYEARQLRTALRATDLALLGGRLGLRAILEQAFLSAPRRRVLYFSYVWKPRATSTLRQRYQGSALRHLARFARGLVFMTAEQVDAALTVLPRNVSAIHAPLGIDFGYYDRTTSLYDLREEDRSRTERLLERPYFILQGSELRLNHDAVALVESTSLTVARVSNNGHRGELEELKNEIQRRKIGDRLPIYERISYPALRFLMKHACAYAGLVDATWQPAGWTSACEALACGLPVVLYEGLTARELRRLGASASIVHSVPMRDYNAFARELKAVQRATSSKDFSIEARIFAAAKLDLENIGPAFAEQLGEVAARD